jgi:hypothetical protein
MVSAAAVLMVSGAEAIMPLAAALLPLPLCCSNTAYDAAAGRLSFSSVHLGCLALLQDTSAHLPYSSWTIRPTGGLGGSTAVIDLQVSSLSHMHSQHCCRSTVLC